MPQPLKYNCRQCGEQYNRKASERWEFFPETRICSSCYEQGRNEDHRVWCFGKTDVVNERGETERFGYDPDRRECGEICPDRNICPLFIVKRYKVRGKAVKAAKVSLLKKLGKKQTI